MEITVYGFKNNNGKLNFALYNSENSFNQENNAIYRGTFGVNNKIANIVLKNLPIGMYAFALYHDSNENKTLDKNMLGIPKEGYGFSNNASATFGPPSWEQSKFEISNQTKVSQKIVLIHY